MVFNNSIKGIATLTCAGLSSGSFPAPAKGIVSTRKWEHVWLIYSFCAMALLPLGVAMWQHAVILKLLMANPAMSFRIAPFGMLWGLGSLLFGVSLVRLGMAITNAMVNGIVILVGSLGPIVIGKVQFNLAQMMWLIGGLSLLTLSLLLCAVASIYRDKVQGPSTNSPTALHHPVRAILIAVAAGVSSSMLNIGFVVGSPLSTRAAALGCSPLLASVSIWVPVLLGGAVFNMGYPAYLISRNRSWSVLVRGEQTGQYWLRSMLMGLLWFGAILLYGAGASFLGRAGAVYGWALFTASAILTSNAWGFITKEWKGSGNKPKLLMWLSTALLCASLVVIASQQASR